jgi:hypothetical protein
MPILGVTASQITGHLTSPWSPQGAYDALASTTLSGTAASITFNGIPSGYKHLELRYIARGTGSAQTYALISANGDSASGNYIAHDLFGSGSSALSSFYGNQTGFPIQKITGTNATSGNFGSGILTILDYSNPGKFKTGRNLGGQDSNGSGEIDFVSSVWLSLSPITSLSASPASGSFAANTTISLYGIK